MPSNDVFLGKVNNICILKQTIEQNRTRDIEIKNKLTVTRGEQGRQIAGKKGKG